MYTTAQSYKVTIIKMMMVEVVMVMIIAAFISIITVCYFTSFPFSCNFNISTVVLECILLRKYAINKVFFIIYSLFFFDRTTKTLCCPDRENGLKDYHVHCLCPMLH